MRADVAVGRIGVWASHLGLLPAASARDAARGIEDLGYTALWVGEAEGKEALTHAAFLLAATRRVTVATGIANIWARDARAMMNGARTLAEGFDDRFLLGVGASHPPLVQRRGGAYRRPLEAMEGYLGAMAKAVWRGPDLPGEPPVVLAALGPRMLALARDRADGAHTFLVPPEHTRRAREVLGPDRLLAPEQAVVLADSRPDARAAADRHLGNYLALGNYRRNLARLGWSDADLDGTGSDALFDALIAWGDPATVAERVGEHLEAGADHVAVHPLLPSAEQSPLTPLRDLAPYLVGSGG